MDKKTRQKIFNKFKGKCAYCGCDLTKGWHVDHLQPIRRYSNGTAEHPEHECVDNYMPSCASCNINKHSGSLEDFRQLISGFKKHLNELNTQYKISKRYGLVTEVDKPVIFYFETLSEKEVKIA